MCAELERQRAMHPSVDPTPKTLAAANELAATSMQPSHVGRDEGSMMVFRIRLHFSIAGTEES